MSRRLNPIPIFLWLAAAAAVWLAGAGVLRLLGPVSLLLAALGGGALLLLRPPAFRRGADREAGWRCLRCGYDLRMSGDVCPECGGPIPEDLRRRRRIAAEMKAGRERERGPRPAEGSGSPMVSEGEAFRAGDGGGPSC